MEKKKVILELDLEEAEALQKKALRESVVDKLDNLLRPHQDVQGICFYCGHPAKFHYKDGGCGILVRGRISEGPIDEKRCGCCSFASVVPVG